jgi:hypothetical protein
MYQYNDKLSLESGLEANSRNIVYIKYTLHVMGNVQHSFGVRIYTAHYSRELKVKPSLSYGHNSLSL